MKKPDKKDADKSHTISKENRFLFNRIFFSLKLHNIFTNYYIFFSMSIEPLKLNLISKTGIKLVKTVTVSILIFFII